MSDSSIASHVQDDKVFHVPRFLWDVLPEAMRHPDSGSVHCPHVWPLKYNEAGEVTEWYILSKYMCLEVVAALIIIAIFVPLAWKISQGGAPKGRVWNFFEAFLLFIRDQVARPAIGGKEADRFLPFLWTMFFFVLGCNLLGMVPWCGSPTGALAVTGVLAGFTFLTVVGAGMAKFGPAGFWIGLVPDMKLPLVLAVVIWPMLFVIELAGLLIKHFVLSVRLLANIFAGHVVLAVIIGFITAAAESGFALRSGVTAASVFGAVFLSMLDLFVAFLQAYIFVFLSSLFIGMAVHQH